jgi:hypothetical protein
MKLKHFALTFSLTGILLLYFLSSLIQPTAIELHEIQKYEGKQVVVEGIVTDQRLTNYGSQIITIQDDNSTASAFIEGLVDVHYGDKIQVTGKVEKYKDDWEVIVNNILYVKILQKWQNISIPLRQIAESPLKYEGLNINLTGIIDMVYDGYFYLVDSEEEHNIIVFYKSTKNITLYPGQKVSVSGKFSFDAENFRFKLDLTEDTHQIYAIEEG